MRKTLILAILTIILWIWFLFIDKKNNSDIIIKEKPSEIIITRIVDNNNKYKTNELNIKTLTNENDNIQLSTACLKSQLDRLVNWLEYSIEYCDNKDNLIKFGGLE